VAERENISAKCDGINVRFVESVGGVGTQNAGEQRPDPKNAGGE
jgi:hypothetical protein